MDSEKELGLLLFLFLELSDAKLIILFHLRKRICFPQKNGFCKVLGIRHLENSLKKVENRLLIFYNLLNIKFVTC